MPLRPTPQLYTSHLPGSSGRTWLLATIRLVLVHLFSDVLCHSGVSLETLVCLLEQETLPLHVLMTSFHDLWFREFQAISEQVLVVGQEASSFCKGTILVVILHEQ